MERRVNLEGILYEGEEFKPLTGNQGNTSGELAHLRNTYMEAEREYFEHILADDEIRSFFLNLVNLNASELLDEATKIQEKLETGQLETPEDLEKMANMSPEEKDEFHMKNLEAAEGLMCLLFAAVRDKANIKNKIKGNIFEK